MVSKGTVLMRKYEIGRLLGKGTFAKVYYARNISNGQNVAIKVIDKDKVMKVGLMEHVKREISILSLIRHPNVVQLFEVMASKSKIYFVMEYAKGGELFSKVAKGNVSEDDSRKYFQQLINAIDCCHRIGVYHRDLKPENLLLDENDNLKVSDFGLSALVDSKTQDNLLHTTCGTPAYVAPEVISKMGYDGAKADIWSCGVILFVLMAGYYPFHDSNLINMYKKIGRGEFKFPSWFSSGARKLISKILDPNPSTRVSIAKIRENKWFKKGLRDRKLKIKEKTYNSFPLTVPAVSSSSDSNTDEEKQDSTKIATLNAFDIISLSVGFDLSSLFADNHQKKESWFICKESVSAIISKLHNLAQHLKLKVTKKDGGVLKMETQNEGRNSTVALCFEIFEVSPSLYLVEIKMSAGDTLEYQKLVKECIRPALVDIVWAWQGDREYCLHQQS